VIGKIYVRDIDQSHAMQVLEPIWLTKTGTIKLLRGRIENVLDWTRERGYRSCELESQHLAQVEKDKLNLGYQFFKKWKGMPCLKILSKGDFLQRRTHPIQAF
jgi:hypothetical protein